jgi:hypothetical protein
MDIPYAGGDLLDITVVAVQAMPPKLSLRLAFRTPSTSAARATQQTNRGPLNYAGPSNKS